ncbi:DNA polymerase III subunit beta [Patescibacteria group bacterium]|nr:DNA polymerase III subunit beta [Patescibacteria group bacterium]
MKLSCSQNDLSSALSVVNRAVSQNNTLPVLNNILLRAEKGRLSLSSTNLEIAINATIEANIKTEGSITVPAKTINSYVPLLKDESVGLSLKGETTLEIESLGSDTKMKGIPSEEFPSLPKIEGAQSFFLPAAALKDAIEQVAFSASTNISRPVLTGVLWKIDGDKMRLVATDSYRLSEKTLVFEKDTGVKMEMIVPSRTTQELAKILAGSEEKELEVLASKNQVMFKIGGIEVISRLIDGNYPDYEKILPESSKVVANLKADDFALALKKVLVIVKENNNSVRIRVSGDKLMILSDETQVGEGNVELALGSKSGEAEVALNAQYLVDVLGHIGGAEVNFGLNDGLSPVMVVPATSEDYVHIIMPLKI